jgi:replication factor A1
MYKIPLPELKEKIITSGKINAEDLENRIKEKINELSGLISEEGAAHIIANECGVDLTPPSAADLKIKEIYAGMKSVGTVGKVVQKFEMREFQKGAGTGKVCSLILGDETGTIRVVFWNEQVDQLSGVNEDDILKLSNTYVRDNRGSKEIHMGNEGEIEVNPDGVTIENVRRTADFERKKIGDLAGGEQNVEIMAAVVQVFDPHFFSLCPECNKKVMDNNCVTHGVVEPVNSYVLNAVVDDGSGNIRCVFWKNQTSHLTGKEEEEMVSLKENPNLFEDTKTDLLGEQFKLMGRVQKNEMFNRLEFSVQTVEKANPSEELNKEEKVE